MKSFNLKLYFLFFSVCFSSLALSQYDPVYDSLFQAKTKELGIREMISTVHRKDTSYVYEVQKFNENGEVIEQISPMYNNRFRRHRTEFDSLGRRIHFTIYNELDTTKIQSEEKWIFIDSTHYRSERYNSNHALSETVESESILKDKSVWIYKIKKSPDYKRVEKELSVHTNYGDTMLISAYVDYDREGNMDDVKSRYRLTEIDSVKQEIRHTSGICHAKLEGIDELMMFDEVKLKEFYENKEKYLLKILNGDCTYEFEEDFESYKIYNFQEQLLEDRESYYSKTTYEYNDLGQLIKSISWGFPTYSESQKIVATAQTTYEYDENGLRKSIVTVGLESNYSEKLTFEYR